MKKYIMLIILLNCIGVFSQETILPLEEKYSTGDPHTNVYYKDITGYLNQYIGSWEYSSNAVYFKIKFYKRPHAYGSFGLFDHIFEDELRSFILYKVLENGVWVTKYNTFAVVLIGDEHANSDCIRGNSKTHDDKLRLSYTEPTTLCRRLKFASLELQAFEEGGIQKLGWKRKVTRNNRIGTGFCPDGTPWDESGFIIPKDMVLTKVN